MTSSQQEKAHDPSDEVHVHASPLAWIVIGGVVLLNTAVNLTWLSASSAPKSTSLWMQVSYPTLNWLANVGAILNTLVSIPLPYFYERFGIKSNLVVAGIINMLGCWIRYLAVLVPAHHRFLVVMIGQILAGIAGPIVTNISTKLAAAWFPPQLRGISNTLTTLSIGPALAVLLIPRLTPNASNTPFMFFVVAIFGTIAAVLMPFLPRQPHAPPSYSACQERIGVFAEMGMLAKQMDFWRLLILASTTFGMALCFSVIIIEAILPFGYSEQQAGLCVAVVIISGFFGGGLTGYWMGSRNDHNIIIKIFTPLNLFTYVMFIFQIVPDSLNVIIIACIANGFASYGLFSVYLELASEMTYPVPECVSNCIISAACSVTTFVFTVILDALRADSYANPPFHMRSSLIAACIIVAVGSLPCFFIKGEMKRLAVDQSLLK